MATYLTAVLLALCGLAASATGTAQAIVRRHEKDLLMQLDSKGEVKSVARDDAKNAMLFEELYKTAVIDYCNYDFPLGKKGTSKCSMQHKLIYSPEECLTAAKSAGATVHMDSFSVLEAEKDNFPKGCSMRACTHDNTAMCYYYNGIADTPKTPTGTPVCSRPRLELSLTSGCPNGYKAILDRTTCENLYGCMSKNKGEPFVIESVPASTKDRNHFPEGCFLAADGANVFYNPVTAVKPTHHVGTSICNVTKFTKCSSTACQAEDSNLEFQAHWAQHVSIPATSASHDSDGDAKADAADAIADANNATLKQTVNIH